MLHHWKRWRSGWMGLWANWSSARCPCPWQGVWTRWPSKVPSNPKYSVILWFYDFSGAGHLGSSFVPPGSGSTRIGASRLLAPWGLVPHWGSWLIGEQEKVSIFALADCKTLLSQRIRGRTWWKWNPEGFFWFLYPWINFCFPPSPKQNKLLFKAISCRDRDF